MKSIINNLFKRSQKRLNLRVGVQTILGPKFSFDNRGESNIHVGEDAVIAAGSVVTKNIPPYCVAAGNPAKTIRELSKDGN